MKPKLAIKFLIIVIVVFVAIDIVLAVQMVQSNQSNNDSPRTGSEEANNAEDVPENIACSDITINPKCNYVWKSDEIILRALLDGSFTISSGPLGEQKVYQGTWILTEKNLQFNYDEPQAGLPTEVQIISSSQPGQCNLENSIINFDSIYLDPFTSCPLGISGDELIELQVESLNFVSENVIIDSKYEKLDDCLVKYKNPNIPDFNITYDECVWDIEISRLDSTSYPPFRMDFGLTFKLKSSQESIGLIIVIPGHYDYYGWPSCYTDLDEIVYIQEGLYRTKYNNVYTTNIGVKGTEKFDMQFKSAGEMPAVTEVDPNSQYCESVGPSIATRNTISDEYLSGDKLYFYKNGGLGDIHESEVYLFTAIGDNPSPQLLQEFDLVMSTMEW